MLPLRIPADHCFHPTWRSTTTSNGWFALMSGSRETGSAKWGRLNRRLARSHREALLWAPTCASGPTPSPPVDQSVDRIQLLARVVHMSLMNLYPWTDRAIVAHGYSPFRFIGLDCFQCSSGRRLQRTECWMVRPRSQMATATMVPRMFRRLPSRKRQGSTCAITSLSPRRDSPNTELLSVS